MLDFFSGKKVLVTGGTGSLGKKLIKTLQSYKKVLTKDFGKKFGKKKKHVLYRLYSISESGERRRLRLPDILVGV